MLGLIASSFFSKLVSSSRVESSSLETVSEFGDNVNVLTRNYSQINLVNLLSMNILGYTNLFYNLVFLIFLLPLVGELVQCLPRGLALATG